MSKIFFNKIVKIGIALIISASILFCLVMITPPFTSTYWIFPSVLLVFLIIFGLTFNALEKMWENPPVRYLIIILILLTFGGIIFSYYEGNFITRAKDRDAVRKSDIRQIVMMMDIYKEEKNQYLQSETMPIAIGEISPIPTDPMNPSGENPYYWLDNTEDALTGCDEQHFCVWAEFEKTGFFAGSEKGTKELSIQPTKCPCW